jgi:hyperosmotically inducible periplasmic protein
MKSVILSLTCVVALYAAAPAVASPSVPQAGTATSDKAIDKRIEQRLNANASLKPHHIKVSVDGGVATLTGTVATDAQKARAEQLAMVTGVTRVDNQISVDPNYDTKGTGGKIADKTKEGAEKTKEGAEKVAEKTKEGAGKVADKTKEGLSKTGEVITDGWITTRVHSKFVGEDLLKDSDINVDTNDHVVTLKGTVMSAAGRRRAVAQAKEVEGVHKVVDLLTIGPKKP